MAVSRGFTTQKGDPDGPDRPDGARRWPHARSERAAAAVGLAFCRRTPAAVAWRRRRGEQRAAARGVSVSRGERQTVRGLAASLAGRGREDRHPCWCNKRSRLFCFVLFFSSIQSKHMINPTMEWICMLANWLASPPLKMAKASRQASGTAIKNFQDPKQCGLGEPLEMVSSSPVRGHQALLFFCCCF